MGGGGGQLKVCWLIYSGLLIYVMLHNFGMKAAVMQCRQRYSTQFESSPIYSNMEDRRAGSQSGLTHISSILEIA